MIWLALFAGLCGGFILGAMSMTPKELKRMLRESFEFGVQVGARNPILRIDDD